MTTDEPFTWTQGSRMVNALGDERWLAQRVQDERKARGWSQAELSRTMGQVGHPLHQSAISKIESPKPGERRGVTIGEAIGFSKVFDIPLGELLLPPATVRSVEAWQLYLQASEERNEIRNRTRKYEHLVNLIRRARPGSEFVEQLERRRAKVMEKITAELTAIAVNDGDPPDYYDPEAEAPPDVLAIDDILAAIRDATHA